MTPTILELTKVTVLRARICVDSSELDNWKKLRINTPQPSRWTRIETIGFLYREIRLIREPDYIVSISNQS